MPVSTRQEEKAPGFEEVWALIKEVGEKQKETAVQMQETDVQMQETDRRMQETDRRMQETDRRMQETDRRMQETDCKFKEIERVVDKLCGKLGNIDTNIGYAAESYFYTALAKSLMFGNIRFDEVIPNLKKERKGASCEFDLVLLNHEAVAIIEVKHRIHPSLPEEMATRKAAQFRRFFPEYKNYTLYLGVAGLSMDDAVVEHARDFGVGVLKQDGDAIESFDVPLKAY